MRLLLDTHALIWFCERNPALSDRARAAMEDAANTRFVSYATSWERAIKLSIGKLQLLVGFDAVFPGVLMANGFEVLPSSFEHFRAVLSLPRHHGDPFDRLLIAQAQIEGLTLVTNDPRFSEYGVPLLW